MVSKPARPFAIRTGRTNDTGVKRRNFNILAVRADPPRHLISRRCKDNYGEKVCRTAARANLLFLCSLNMQISRIFNAVDTAYATLGHQLEHILVS